MILAHAAPMEQRSLGVWQRLHNVETFACSKPFFGHKSLFFFCLVAVQIGLLLETSFVLVFHRYYLWRWLHRPQLVSVFCANNVLERETGRALNHHALHPLLALVAPARAAWDFCWKLFPDTECLIHRIGNSSQKYTENHVQTEVCVDNMKNGSLSECTTWYATVCRSAMRCVVKVSQRFQVKKVKNSHKNFNLSTDVEGWKIYLWLETCWRFQASKYWNLCKCMWWQ